MPTPTKGPRLGGGPAHERLMLANLATALFEHDRITTTEAKAKRLRPLAEKLITFARNGELHDRRQVLKVIRIKDVVHKLFAEIGPKFSERPGGYTRIIKVNPRKGDNAPMAVIELVEGDRMVYRSACGSLADHLGTRLPVIRARSFNHVGPGQAQPGALKHIFRVEADIVQAASSMTGEHAFATSFPNNAFGNAVRTAAQVVATKAGVAAIPVSAFYAEAPVTHVVRFCFVKEDATLDTAVERIAAARQTLAS